MSKWLDDPANPEPEQARREFWTATASWYEKGRLTTDPAKKALSKDELSVVVRHLTARHGGFEGFEILLEHHDVHGISRRITDYVATRPEQVPDLIAAAREALKRRN